MATAATRTPQLARAFRPDLIPSFISFVLNTKKLLQDKKQDKNNVLPAADFSARRAFRRARAGPVSSDDAMVLLYRKIVFSPFMRASVEIWRAQNGSVPGAFCAPFLRDARQNQGQQETKKHRKPAG
jgi:hypothetical protein